MYFCRKNQWLWLKTLKTEPFFPFIPKSVSSEALLVWLINFLDSDKKYSQCKHVLFDNLLLKMEDKGKSVSDMADNYRGQSLITKYVWVIETIYRRRKISFKELKEPVASRWHQQRCGYSQTHLWQLALCHLGYVRHQHSQWEPWRIPLLYREWGRHQQERTPFLALQHFLCEQCLSKQPKN